MPATEPAERHRVAEYYDSTQRLYSRLWSRRSVHYGLWLHGTRSREEAMLNLDRCVADELALAPGSKVLDAGCGIGGTSLFLAGERGMDVLGITLSGDQLRRAKQLAARSIIDRPPVYETRDFLATGLPSGSFDGVVAIESSCYASDSANFISEAARLLRPGGRLVVADGFVTRDLDAADRRRLRRMLSGWAMVALEHQDGFHANLERHGFEHVVRSDRQAEILPSARQIARLSWLGLGVMALPYLFGRVPKIWVDHGVAGVSQHKLFRNGAVGYRIFRATRAAWP